MREKNQKTEIGTERSNIIRKCYLLKDNRINKKSFDPQAGKDHLFLFLEDYIFWMKPAFARTDVVP